MAFEVAVALLVHIIEEDDLSYIAAKETENGAMFLVSKRDNQEFISEGNCIVFIQIGAGSAGYVTYQPQEFIGMSGKTSCGYSKNLNQYTGMFLKTVLDLERPKYNYERKFGTERMQGSMIKLPVDAQGKPDWQFMEDYIKTLPYSRAI